MVFKRSKGRRDTGGPTPSSYCALVFHGLIVLAGLMASAAMAGTSSTAFTYQGQLREFGEPVTATCHFEFDLYDAETNGTLIGSVNSLPATPVEDGLFQVELDFGPGVFSGPDRWLSILVDCSGLAPLVELTPRQKVTPAPLAQFAATAGSVLNPPASGWTISGNDIFTSLSGNVGIGTNAPQNRLDVEGKITVSQSIFDEMVIINDDQWTHFAGLQDFGDGGDHWIIASREGSGESAGIYGDGDHVTIWSPGDGAPGQPAALLYVLDEDLFSNADSDPFNNGALKAYVDFAGNWVVASDRRRKTNIEPMQGSLERLLQINGYQYQFIRNADDIKDDRAAPTHYGVLAQELESVFPDAVQRSDAGDYYVSYTALVPALIEAIREQQGTIEQLNGQNASLADRLAAIEARLNELSGN